MNLLVSRVYQKLPVNLQNLAFSAWGLNTNKQRYGAEFRRKLEWLEETQWWTEAQISLYQDDKLQAVVRHAYETVPLYKQKMKQLGLQPTDIRSRADLSKLPILSKREVREKSASMVSTAYNPRSLKMSLTSGTSGTPLKIYLTKEALQFQWAVWWRHKSRFGLRVGDKHLMFGARLPVPISVERPPYWRHNWATSQTYLSTYHLTPTTMLDVVNWLNDESFVFYAGYPSAMYVLANFIREQQLNFGQPPRYIVTGSDALLPAFERTIGSVFNAPVTDQYGSAEACGNFARCEYKKYHLDAEFCIVELFPVPESNDSRLRRLVFTGLANPAMPFLRYDIGDYGLLSEGPCQCGRKTLTLDCIEGRTEDYVRTPDGRMAIGMNQVFEWAPEIIEAQIQQEKLDEIVVLIVPTKRYSHLDQDILEREFRNRLGNTIRIKFRLVEEIPRNKSGKFRAVVSCVSPATSEEQALRDAVQQGIKAS
jgi:phenylacetate-CoA ligase